MLIAQISDLHVEAPGGLGFRGVDAAESLGRCVAHLARMTPGPEVVLVTGDLVNGGQEEEYAVVRDILGRLQMPVYVIPGNHDERGAFSRAFADHDYLPRDGEFLHYVIERYPLRLVALDTVVPGELGGEMCPARIAWLERTLAQGRDRPTVIFMHHPPFATGLDAMDAMGCAGGEAMGEVVARNSQVERVLCGHVHRPVHVRWHGTVASIAPSTAVQFNLDLTAGAALGWVDEPAAFALHLWRPGTGLISHTSLVGGFGAPRPEA